MIDPLDYATPEPKPVRDATFWAMFTYLAPAGLFVSALVVGGYIEKASRDGDTRDFASPCCAITMGPLALAFLFPLIKETMRPGGRRMLLRAGCYWLAVPLASWLFLHFIVKFNLFRHWG